MRMKILVLVLMLVLSFQGITFAEEVETEYYLFGKIVEFDDEYLLVDVVECNHSYKLIDSKVYVKIAEVPLRPDSFNVGDGVLVKHNEYKLGLLQYIVYPEEVQVLTDEEMAQFIGLMKAIDLALIAPDMLEVNEYDETFVGLVKSVDGKVVKVSVLNPFDSSNNLDEEIIVVDLALYGVADIPKVDDYIAFGIRSLVVGEVSEINVTEVYSISDSKFEVAKILMKDVDFAGFLESIKRLMWSVVLVLTH